MQQRQQIMQILSEKPARNPLQTLSKEDLLAQMTTTWDDLCVEMTYLEGKGYLAVRRRYIGTRVFESFYLTPEGTDWIEGQALLPLDTSSRKGEVIPPSPPKFFQQTRPALTIFFSYAHGDEVLRKELEKQLRVLQHQGLIDMWYDREISAGTETKLQIDAHLNTAQIILLLVSPDFMGSDYCYSKEMKRAIERHESGEARVIPILLRPVYYEGAPFEKLRMLPANGKPVTRWQHRDEAFEDVAREISKVVKELTSSPAHFPPIENQNGS